MSELKFKLTNKTKINAFGVRLFQIEATVDIVARGVKKGDKGGWVQSERLADGEPRIYGNAWVYDNAQVSDNAQVYGDARVCGNACVYGDAWIHGNAQVSDNAQVYGYARVYVNAQVFEGAQIYGDAYVRGNAQVYGNAWVCGNAQVSENAQVSGNARVSGNAALSAKKRYSKGYFVGGDNSDEPTFSEITDKTGSSYWRHQYVIGDYKIDDLDEPEVSEMTVSDIEKLVGHKVKIINKEGK